MRIQQSNRRMRLPEPFLNISMFSLISNDRLDLAEDILGTLDQFPESTVVTGGGPSGTLYQR